MLNATIEKLKANLFAKYAKEVIQPDLENIQKLIMTLGESLGTLSEIQKNKVESVIVKIQKLSSENQKELIEKLKTYETSELAQKVDNVDNKINEVQKQVEKINNKNVIEAVAALSETIKKKDFKGVDGITPLKGVDYYTQSDIDELITEIVTLIPKAKDGKNGIDGKDGSPDTPKDIKTKLERLKGVNRLDSSAIKNLPQIIYETATQAKQLGIKRQVKLVDGDYTAQSTDEVLKFAQNATLVLPAATGSGQYYLIRAVNCTVIINALFDSTINEEATQTIFAGEGIQVVDDGVGTWGIY